MMSTADEHPPVTWLLPVRNGMPFLTDTLRSLTSQTYPHHRVLAWDNGSTDGSVDELHRWIGPGQALTGEVVSNRPLGLGASLAAMVERAETELCARIDSDDMCLPHRLSRQVRYMQAHPDVAVLGSGMILTDVYGRTISIAPSRVTRDADLRWHLRFGNAVCHPTVMLRRSIILASGNYANIAPGQDYDLWCRVAAKHRMANLVEPLVRYRMHDRSVTAANLSRSTEVSLAIRQRNLPRLWPGLCDQAWRHLTDLLTDPMNLNVSLDDWRTLRRVATRSARAAGEDARYFRRTERYRRHALGLLTRAAKRQPVIGSVWPLLRQLYRPFATPAASIAPAVQYQPHSAAA